MEQLFEVINLVFTPGKVAIMFAGFIPALFGLYRMRMAGGEPYEYRKGTDTVLLGSVFGSVVLILVFGYTFFASIL